jgi:hypothetical protein
MSKSGGTFLCTPCDRSFAANDSLQQVSRFTTFAGQFSDFLRQHNRDKHHNSPTQAPTAKGQPPVQQPRVQAQNKPASTVRTHFSFLLLLGPPRSAKCGKLAYRVRDGDDNMRELFSAFHVFTRPEAGLESLVPLYFCNTESKIA